MKIKGFYNKFKAESITVLITVFLVTIISFVNGSLSFGYDPESKSPIDLGTKSRVTYNLYCQLGTPTVTGSGTFMFSFGTQSVLGTGSQGYSPATGTAYPRMLFVYGGGSMTCDFINTTIKQNGFSVALAGSLTGYISNSNGAGSNTTLENPTFTGVGTSSGTIALTGTISASGTNISGAEVSYLDGLVGNINTFQTTHGHGGTDSVRVIHDNVGGTGTNSHATIDTFIASKAQASGLASLDSASFVVQNPASGTSTPGVSKIPISLGTGLLDDSWLSSTISKLGQTIDLATEVTGNYDNITGTTTIKPTQVAIGTTTLLGALNASGTITATGFSGGGEGLTNLGNLKDYTVVFMSPVTGHQLQISGTTIINATATAAVAWSGITGNPLDNGSITATSGANKITMTDSSGKFNFGTNTFTVVQLTGTTTAITGTSTNGRWYNLISTGNVDMATKLMLHMDNPGTSTFIDSSASGYSVTAVGGAIGTTTAKFGSGGCLIDSSDDRLSVPDSSDWVFGTGDFTIDTWLYPFDTSHKAYFWSQHFDVNNYVHFFVESGTIEFYCKDAAVTKAYYAYTWSRSANTWYHIALVRNGTSLTLYINGTSVTWTSIPTAIGSNSLPDVATGVDIGGQAYDSTYFCNGVLDEFRVSKGIARWTSNFTPPTAPYFPDYIFYSAQYIPPGTTTSYLSIIDDGTNTNKIKVVIGGTEYSTTTTGYLLDVAYGNILGKSFVTTPSNSKVKTDLPGMPAQEALSILDNSQVHKFYYKDKEVSSAVAEKVAKENYIIKDFNADYALWEKAHQSEYMIIVTGTGTVADVSKMKEDFIKQNKINKTATFDTLNNKSDLIQTAKANLEKSDDKRNNSINYGIEIDSGCPAEILNQDGLPVLEKWCGFNYAVGKGLLEEIKVLKARLEILEAKP